MPATRHHRDPALAAALRGWGIGVNSDEGRAARRLFPNADHFERYMNTALARASIRKHVFIDRHADDWWEAREARGFGGVRSEVQAVLRVAANMGIQRDQLNIFSFYIAACIEVMKAPDARSQAPGTGYVDSRHEWERMTTDPTGYTNYFERALSGFEGLNFYVIKYVNDMFARGFDPEYLHDVGDDREHGVFTMLYTDWQLDELYGAGIPSGYARDLRLAERSFSLNPQDVIDIYQSNVPIEYVTGCIKNGIYPYSILRFWKEGIPVEYAALV